MVKTAGRRPAPLLAFRAGQPSIARVARVDPAVVWVAKSGDLGVLVLGVLFEDACYGHVATWRTLVPLIPTYCAAKSYKPEVLICIRSCAIAECN